MSQHRIAHAVCWSVVDCGVQVWHGAQGPRWVRELRIGFELSEQHDKNGRKLTINRLYNRSFHKKSSLYRDLTTWLEVPYLGAHARSGRFHLAELLRLGARLELERTDTGLRIGAIRAAPAMHLCENDPLFFNLDKFDVEAFHRLPDRLRDHIMASPTFQAIHGHYSSHTDPDSAQPHPNQLNDEEIIW